MKPAQGHVERPGRPPFWPSVFAAALCAIAVWLWQHSLLLALLGWRVPLLLVFSSFGLWLIWQRFRGVGFCSAAAVLAVAQLLLLLVPLLGLVMLGQSVLLSVLRGLLFQRRWWPRLQDLVLSLVALVAAFAVLVVSHSAALAMWTLLFLHAVLAALPSAMDGLKSRITPVPATNTNPDFASPSQADLQQRFKRAHQSACAAWERCQQQAFTD